MAGRAVPDAHVRALHGVLAAEDTCIDTVLADLHLLDLLTDRGTVAGTVLTRDPNLLGALTLQGGISDQALRTAGHGKDGGRHQQRHPALAASSTESRGAGGEWTHHLGDGVKEWRVRPRLRAEFCSQQIATRSAIKKSHKRKESNHRVF